jgi:hypothetical protein
LLQLQVDDVLVAAGDAVLIGVMLDRELYLETIAIEEIVGTS